jgi:hypothetical protein
MSKPLSTEEDEVSFEAVPDLSRIPGESRELFRILAEAAEVLRLIRQRPDERLPVIA